MKKTLVLACTLALLAVAGFAQAPGTPHVTLADIMAPAAAPALAVADQNQPVLASHRARISGEKSICTASCGSYNVTCSYTPPSSCIAVDRNCPSTQGYVSCNGNTTYCMPTCTPTCTEGAIRNVFNGSCCDNNTKEKEQQVCSGGVWNYTGVITCSGPCGIREPIYP
jgi:hypothetical protein